MRTKAGIVQARVCFSKGGKKNNRVNKVHNTTAEPRSRTFFSFCGVQRSPNKTRCLLSNNYFVPFDVFFANLPTLAIKAGQLTCDFGFFFLLNIIKCFTYWDWIFQEISSGQKLSITWSVNIKNNTNLFLKSMALHKFYHRRPVLVELLSKTNTFSVL